MFGRIAPGPRPAAYLIALLIALGVVAAAPAGGASGEADLVRVVVQFDEAPLAKYRDTLPGLKGVREARTAKGHVDVNGAGEPRVPEASRRQARRLRAEASRRDTGRIRPVALRHGLQRDDRRRAARPAGRDPAASERRLGDGDVRARARARREPGAARAADALAVAAVEPARCRSRQPRCADRLGRQRPASVLQRQRASPRRPAIRRRSVCPAVSAPTSPSRPTRATR